MVLDRRMTLTGLALGGAAAASGVPALAKGAMAKGAKTHAPDLTSVAGRLRTYMLMRAALDDRLVIGCVTGRYYGVTEDKVLPLFGVAAATFTRFRPAATGGHELISAEVAWFTDLETGKVLDKFRNPFNDHEGDVAQLGPRPVKAYISDDLGFRPAISMSGSEVKHAVLPIQIQAGMVSMTERVEASFVIPGNPRRMRYLENSTYSAHAKALTAPAATRVLSQVHYTNIASWRPWMAMGDAPGHLSAIASGFHDISLENMHPQWLEATRARRPEVLRDPAAILAPLWDAK